MSRDAKCPKCGHSGFREKRVRLSGTAGMFNPLEATARICLECGHIELHAK